jgi:hypothetical protein
MKKIIPLLVSAVVAVMMTVSGNASAIDSVAVFGEDAQGDIPWRYDMKTGDLILHLDANQQVSKIGCLDMERYSFTQHSDNTYTFEMWLYAKLPEPGDPLWSGGKRLEWLMWTDPAPWNPVLAPEWQSTWMVNLTFDGALYRAWLVEYEVVSGIPVIPLEFGIADDRMSMWIEIPAGVLTPEIDDWWCPATRAWMGPLGTYGMFVVDMPDWGSVEGQVWYDLPWPDLSVADD